MEMQVISTSTAARNQTVIMERGRKFLLRTKRLMMVQTYPRYPTSPFGKSTRCCLTLMHLNPKPWKGWDQMHNGGCSRRHRPQNSRRHKLGTWTCEPGTLI
jgi:hypothetical protein